MLAHNTIYPCSLCAFSAISSRGLTQHYNAIHQDAPTEVGKTYTHIGHPYLTGIDCLLSSAAWVTDT